MPYGPHTDGDRERMLASIGVASIDELFADIPAALRASGIDLPGPEPELQLAARLQALAATNRTDLVSFLGAGVYRHWTPPAVDQLLLRGEWYTAYTPYQPEVSQGTLQSIYEYESLIAELVGLDVVSASHYDGAAATAEAALMTCRQTRRERVLVSHARAPARQGHDRDVLPRRARARGDPRRCGGRRRRHNRSRGPRGAPRGRRAPGRRRDRGPPELLRAARASHRDRRAGACRRRAFVAVIEPVSLAVLAAARRVWRRHRGGGGPATRHLAAVRRAVPRHPRLDRRARPPDPRPARRHDHGPRRPARLRHDACARESRTSGATRRPAISARTRRCSRSRRRSISRRSARTACVTSPRPAPRAPPSSRQRSTRSERRGSIRARTSTSSPCGSRTHERSTAASSTAGSWPGSPSPMPNPTIRPSPTRSSCAPPS